MTAPTRVPATYADCNRLWVDSWLRAQAQEVIEARVLLQLGGRADGARALELGPGRRGTGLLLARDAFGAESVHGVELHPASVQACRARVGSRAGGGVSLEQGDVTRLTAADASYDAVFCYHLLHHADDWRAAVVEAARVLTSGGRLYVAEMTARFVDSAPLRAVSHHPRDGDRPTAGGIAAACTAAGLVVVGQETRYLGWWTALVAQKPA